MGWEVVGPRSARTRHPGGNMPPRFIVMVEIAPRTKKKKFIIGRLSDDNVDVTGERKYPKYMAWGKL